MTAETKIPTAVLRAAMNAEFCGVTMRDALMAGTDHGYEVLEASLRTALAALTEAKQQGPGEAVASDAEVDVAIARLFATHRNDEEKREVAGYARLIASAYYKRRAPQVEAKPSGEGQ